MSENKDLNPTLLIFGILLACGIVWYALDQITEPYETEKNTTNHILNINTIGNYCRCQCKYQLGTGSDYSEGQTFRIEKNGTIYKR